MYHRCGQRLLDLVLTVFALLLFGPVMLIVALLVRRKIGAPVFFRQQRLGRDGAPFAVIKFRTMTNARGADGTLLPDDERMTPFGGFLRRSSLDELPELLNVLRGEMSLVGPRPLFVHYAARYTPEQMRRHAVRPGLTGWAQVNGRNAIAWEEKFAYDLWYVEHQSLVLDLKIICRTVGQVLRRSGINETGHATMSEYMGVAHLADGGSAG
ncbi:MAG: sugar transferase [Thermomicrobia bacterium]|nr:sugar transferase [Thermomicrobia bacterium]MCA1724976.1 sugar transferase [Thermomicrobia bacterium]